MQNNQGCKTYNYQHLQLNMFQKHNRYMILRLVNSNYLLKNTALHYNQYMQSILQESTDQLSIECMTTIHWHHCMSLVRKWYTILRLIKI